MILYHYFEQEKGPLRNLSDLPLQDADRISFTYGDMFPTFSQRICDGREYRNNVYTYQEILQLINQYGLPQIWNPNGEHGPERYIEAQIWYDILPEFCF